MSAKKRDRNPKANGSDPAAPREPPGEDITRVLTSRSETRAFYNKISRIYDLMAEHSEAPVRQKCLHKLAPRSGETLLEIGCGTGHVTAELARAAGAQGRVYALDLSDGMLGQTRQLLDRQGLGKRVCLCCSDAVKIPLKDSSVDALYTSFTLELFDTPEIAAVLEECRRVLRSGGRLAIAAVTREGHHELLVGAYEWTHRHFPNFLDCRPIFARRSIEAAGFWVQDAEVAMMWVPVEIVLAVKA
jgi:demethylmenaquinone methyltransferase/2-methoxy-6-polyprenyl-1,4-benzoquinol methylase